MSNDKTSERITIWEPENGEQVRIIKKAKCKKSRIYMWLMDEGDGVSDAHWIVKIENYNLIFSDRKEARSFQRLADIYTI